MFCKSLTPRPARESKWCNLSFSSQLAQIPLQGLVLINKPQGFTSHDLVALVRKVVGQKSVGHIGTLDPFATGLMGILLGNGTKLAPYLAKFTKVYWGEIALGLLTDTWDLLGKVKADLRAEAKNITLTSLKNAIATKLGTKLQQPPAYSALKIQGVPAYKRARRGEELNLSPREVTLYDCEVLDFTPPNLVFTARVGSGYYIRSLAYELGRELELPGGTLTKLTRLKIGPFSLEQALEPPLSRPEVADALISLRATLDFLPEYQVNFGEAKKFSQGQTLQLKSDPSLANLSPKSLEKTGESGSESDKVVVKVIDPSGKLLALGELLEYNTLDLNRSQGPFLRPLRVFQTGL